MTKLKIKVCGMTREQNVRDIVQCGPDYLGFIFYHRSLRYVGDSPDPALFDAAGNEVKRVGVFVNEYPEKMLEFAEKYKLDTLQLHGMEAPESCKMLKRQGITVIKAIPGDQIENYSLIQEYSEYVDYLLFDTPTRSHGGSGRKFDWTNLESLKSNIPFFLSGGIASNDVEKLASIENDLFYAADINSRFEIQPGIKDVTAVSSFIKDIRNG